MGSAVGVQLFRTELVLTHLEQSRFRVENGAVGGENGTSDAWCGSGSHKHIRVDCYELICT